MAGTAFCTSDTSYNSHSSNFLLISFVVNLLQAKGYIISDSLACSAYLGDFSRLRGNPSFSLIVSNGSSGKFIALDLLCLAVGGAISVEACVLRIWGEWC